MRARLKTNRFFLNVRKAYDSVEEWAVEAAIKIWCKWENVENIEKYDKSVPKVLSSPSIGICPTFSTFCKGSRQDVRYLEDCSTCSSMMCWK